MLPSFHGERMRAYESIVRDAVARDVERWPVGRAFAIHPRMQSITLDVILRAVFGVTDPGRRSRLAERLSRLLASTSSVGLQFGVLLSRRLGGPDPLAHLQSLRLEIDALLAEEIAERRADPSEDILSMLVSARFEDGEPMDDGEIRDQLMTLLLAGHETTATGLAWTFDLLLRHPRVLDRLVAEVNAGEEAYVRAVVAESLRLRPVVPLAGRRLSVELRMNGLVLPPGTDVTPAIWLAHTRTDRYPEPFAFRPERFLESAPATYAWSRSAAGSDAASAPRSPRWRCASRWPRSCGDRSCARCPRRPSGSARRNVTFSPSKGTRVIAAARSGFPLNAMPDGSSNRSGQAELRT